MATTYIVTGCVSQRASSNRDLCPQKPQLVPACQLSEVGGGGFLGLRGTEHKATMQFRVKVSAGVNWRKQP